MNRVREFSRSFASISRDHKAERKQMFYDTESTNRKNIEEADRLLKKIAPFWKDYVIQRQIIAYWKNLDSSKNILLAGLLMSGLKMHFNGNEKIGLWVYKGCLYHLLENGRFLDNWEDPSDWINALVDRSEDEAAEKETMKSFFNSYTIKEKNRLWFANVCISFRYLLSTEVLLMLLDHVHLSLTYEKRAFFSREGIKIGYGSSFARNKSMNEGVSIFWPSKMETQKKHMKKYCTESWLSEFVPIMQSSFEGDKEAFQTVKKFAKKGNVIAQHHLSRLYLSGVPGRVANQKKMHYWLKKSAKMGYAVALDDLGCDYANSGRTTTAKKCLKNAAELGYIRAQSHLGDLYLFLYIKDKSHTEYLGKSLIWLIRAAVNTGYSESEEQFAVSARRRMVDLRLELEHLSFSSSDRNPDDSHSRSFKWKLIAKIIGISLFVFLTSLFGLVLFL